MIKQQLEQDLKTALLSGDKARATTLRGLKSAILYAEIAAGAREQGLDEETIVNLFAKEAKKRQESADLYVQGGSKERAEAELAEKAIIEAYLPAQLSDDDLSMIVDEVIASLGEAPSPQLMGKVIGLVKGRVQAAADGGRIAATVKNRLNK